MTDAEIQLRIEQIKAATEIALKVAPLETSETAGFIDSWTKIFKAIKTESESKQ